MALDPITAILNIGNTIIDRLIPDKTQAVALKAQLIQAELQGDLAAAHDQLNVDAIEAASNSVFVAGWRPFVGWACGCALVWAYVVEPCLISILIACHVSFDPAKMPTLNMTELIGLLSTMLGMGVMRSIDKVNGVENGH